MSPTPSPRTASDAPQRKKRRTLRDAEAELDACRLSLLEAKRKLVLTARENAKMKVLLMTYIDKDNSLLSSSQLSGAESSQPMMASQGSTSMSPIAEAESAASQSPRDYTTVEEQDSEESGLWSSDFQPDDAQQDALLPVSQLSQVSQVSHLSELSSTSNLDEIINFLEAQDSSDTARLSTLQEECSKLREQQAVVRVGVGVLLLSKQHPGCVLIGQRKGSHGEGKFALPGGHLELYESWEQCAIREVKEETDLDLESARFAYVTNDPMEEEGKHYITILMQAEVTNPEQVRNMEPHKCEGWQWEDWNTLRQRDNMFTPLLHVSRSDFTPAFLTSE